MIIIYKEEISLLVDFTRTTDLILMGLILEHEICSPKSGGCL